MPKSKPELRLGPKNPPPWASFPAVLLPETVLSIRAPGFREQFRPPFPSDESATLAHGAILELQRYRVTQPQPRLWEEFGLFT